MRERSNSKVIGRRKALSLLGFAAAFVASPTMLMMSRAEAQQPATPPPDKAGDTTKSGTERRQERRSGRTERRQERRTGRTERREERRTGRTERREERRDGTEPKK